MIKNAYLSVIFFGRTGAVFRRAMRIFFSASAGVMPDVAQKSVILVWEPSKDRLLHLLFTGQHVFSAGKERAAQTPK